MNAARWVLVGILAGGSVAFFAGCLLGLVVGGRGPCIDCQRWRQEANELDTEWRRLFKDLGVDHGHKLQTVEDELAKTRQAIADLQRNIGVVWDAGVYAGQTFQADRQENGL